MGMARERLSAARAAHAGGFASSATSLAYYAMLYAARAALSEEDRNAKTHRGIWNLFVGTFVVSGRFDRALAGKARESQSLREGVDYDAVAVSAVEADAVLGVAERFVDAVAELVGQ